MAITKFLNAVNDAVINPLILLVFAVAMLIFFWGIVQFINSETSDTKRGEGKKKIIWGLFGMFIMFSAFGLINLILNTFGIDGPDYLGF